jgi:phenylacetate-CoA oxygenase PaaH subunit
VFHQERAERPHTNAGAVHATDPELALQNARDVFVRRPDCVSLWVAPASEIHSLTAEEIGRSGLPAAPASDVGSAPYEVFVKRSQAGSHEHVGTVSAASGPAALAEAVGGLRIEPALVWWVVPRAVIVRTEPGEVGSLFAPALNKPYRDQAYYHTTTLMRRVRGRQRETS